MEKENIQIDDFEKLVKFVWNDTFDERISILLFHYPNHLLSIINQIVFAKSFKKLIKS